MRCKPLSWLLGLILLLGPAAFMVGQTAPEAENEPDSEVQSEPDLWAQFQIIIERNIFSRQRGRRRREQTKEPERPRYVPTPESKIVLKGIVNQNGSFVAFSKIPAPCCMYKPETLWHVARCRPSPWTTWCSSTKTRPGS